MNQVLILIQIIPYQEIRVIFDLGADQVVVADCFQVSYGPQILLVNFVEIKVYWSLSAASGVEFHFS